MSVKVLQVIPSVAIVHGGPSTALRAIESELNKRGCSVTTATTDDDGPGRRIDASRPPVSDPGVKRVYFRKWTEFYKFAPGMAFWLWRNVRNFDVVHVHSLFSFSSIVAAQIARWRGTPYVIRPLGTLNTYGVTRRRPWLKRLSLAVFERRAIRDAAAVHFTSQAEWDQALELGVTLRGVVLPLGVTAPAAAPRDAVEARYPDLAGHRYILYLSRLDPKKNVEGLLRAMNIARRELQSLKLLIAGDGKETYVAGLKALARQLRVDDATVWAGHIEGTVKASALSGAEIFVLPSFSENFGVAAAEALMAGVPCVLGEGVAIAREVAEAGAGFVVSADPGAIAQALKYLAGDARLRDEMASRAAALARSRYTVKVMGKSLVELYQSVLR